MLDIRTHRFRGARPILGAPPRLGCEVVASPALLCDPVNKIFESWLRIHSITVDLETRLATVSWTRPVQIAPIIITVVARVAQPIEWM